MRYPEILKQNDIIGVCAPSSGVPEDLFERHNNAIKNVEQLGYRVLVTESVKKNFKCVSTNAKQRAEEFLSLYKNTEVSAIIPPWGGEFLMDMLPYIDFEYLKTLQPKWISGYSDLTTLTFVMTLLCDIATIHGSNFMNMGYKSIHTSDLFVFEAMKKTEITQNNFEFYGKFNSWNDVRDEAYLLDKENIWKSLSNNNIQFEGRIIGGCLDVICKLIGTPFAPVNSFIEKYKKDGFIWTIESCEMNAADIYRTLWQMKECGWFNYCNGVLVGRPDGYKDTWGFTLKDALVEVFEKINIPVIYDADIGHIPPQIQLVNGAYAKVKYENNKCEIKQIYK